MIHTRRLFANILLPTFIALPVIAVAQAQQSKTSETFEIDGHKAFVFVSPKPAAGNPWLWYAPTLKGVSIVQRNLYFDSLMRAGVGIAGFDLGEVRGAHRLDC